jgi:hypothetical protein
MTDDSVIGGLVAELETALTPPEEGAPAPAAPPPGSPEDLHALLEDVRALGVFGILVAVSDAPPPAGDVHAEIPRKVAEKLRAQLEGEVPADAPLPELVRLFHAQKGAKSRMVLRKLLENTVFEFYDLRDHGLFVDDVGRILDVFKSASGSSDNAQAFMKRLAALSTDTAKFMLGLFPEQISLIYKVAQHQAERAEIDAAFDMFAPKVIWKRVFAILKSLLQKEKRFRLALTVWSRLHGVALTREHMAKLETYLAVKDTKDLVKRALEQKDARRALVEFTRKNAAEIAAIEESF